MSSPWAKIATPDPVSLDEIMSEQLAKDLQAKEVDKLALPTNATDEFQIPEFSDQLQPDADGTCESDAVIAQMLQRQFDKEHDELLTRTQNKYNGTSKVSVSFDNYRRTPRTKEFDSDSEDEEVEDLRDKKEWDRYDENQREFASIPSCGYKIDKNGSMITKHDVTISGRRNACKLLSFPPEFHTGDGAGFDLKLSNKVFNSLKMHWKYAQARRHRIHDKKEDHATAEFGVDQFTRLLLHKMINKQMLERVNGVISVGKEAVILHADADRTYTEAVIPRECVVKVFKTTLSDFKQRDKYIRDDYRFKDRVGKQHTRRIVNLWAEKEMHNLVRVRRAGIPCPEVVHLKCHVLVMSFVGKDHKPAPKLKDARMDAADYVVAYDQIVQNMKDLYSKANLIHADLSEYNILWYNDQCYFIDVSQSVEPRHENAFYFLMRDCGNVTNFFNRKGTEGVMAADELFKSITGCYYGDKIALLMLQESMKMKPHLVDVPGVETSCSFENAWEKSKENDANYKLESVLLVEEAKA